jgi:hypothetical protein
MKLSKCLARPGDNGKNAKVAGREPHLGMALDEIDNGATLILQ